MKYMKKLLNDKYFLFFILFVLIKPGVFSQYDNFYIIDIFLDYSRILITFLSVFLLIKNKLLNKSFLILFYYLYLIIITFINNGDLFLTFVNFLLMFNWLVLFSFYNKFNKELLFNVLEFILSLFIYVNFLTIIIFPNGMYVNDAMYYSNYFLGFDNNLIIYIYLALVVSYLNTKRKCNASNNFIVLLLISLLSVFITKCATSMISLFIFLVLFLSYKYIYLITDFLKNKKKLFLYLIIFIGFIIFLFYKNNFFTFFIQNILNKDLSFSGRTIIWAKYFSNIFDNIFFGHGIKSIDFLLHNFNAYHAHNLFLNMIYEGGLVLLFIFLGITFYFIRSNSNFRFFKIILISLFFAFLFEAYPIFILFYIILLLNFYSVNFTSENIKNDKFNMYIYLFFKRIIDIIFSLCGCLILIALIPIVKLLYVINGDYDSIFYKQNRIGKNGKLFLLYKFRTMYVNSDEILNTIVSKKKYKNEWLLNQKLENDPRITKCGKHLRDLSIDEIPQFYNVLRGDMSLIGPRPYLEREKTLLDSCYFSVISVKPGITGYWQISKANNKSFNFRKVCDLLYVKNYSLVLDSLIFFKTILLMFKDLLNKILKL